MKLDDGRLSFVAQQEVTALDAIHKAVLGKAACAGRVTEDVGACISIHAPTWGATWFSSVRSVAENNFNPRTHVGCDVLANCCKPVARISIHAPTWGATNDSVPKVIDKHFNPRTHVGCDSWASCSFKLI